MDVGEQPLLVATSSNWVDHGLGQHFRTGWFVEGPEVIPDGVPSWAREFCLTVHVMAMPDLSLDPALYRVEWGTELSPIHEEYG